MTPFGNKGRGSNISLRIIEYTDSSIGISVRISDYRSDRFLKNFSLEYKRKYVKATSTIFNYEEREGPHLKATEYSCII